MEISSVPICVTSSLRPHSFAPSRLNSRRIYFESRKKKERRDNRTDLLSEHELKKIMYINDWKKFKKICRKIFLEIFIFFLF